MCGRSQDELRHIVAGPAVNVCSDCVLAMAEAIARQHFAWYGEAIKRLKKAVLDDPL